MPLSHSAKQVYYDGGPGLENMYALVVGGHLDADNSRIDLAVMDANGVWEVKRDVPHSETGGGVTYHKNAI